MKRLVITTLLVLALTVSAFAGSFADVPSNHWAYEAVNELVAAGLIQGYPDGTFKGQNNLTRYEVATMIARLLDALAEARAELIDQVDFMIEDAILTSESGLSAAQAEDVQTILQAVIDKNQELFGGTTVVDSKELSVEQAAEVMDIVNALTGEFAPELYDLGVRIAGLEERVAELEDAAPSVTFSGEYKVDFKDFSYEGYYFTGDGADGHYKSPFDYDAGKKPDYETGKNYKQTLDINVKARNDVLEADLNLKAYSLNFLDNSGDGSFDFDGLDAVITGRDFTATVKKEQQEGMRPYLFGGRDDWDGEKVDGVVVETANGRYFLDGRPYDTTDAGFAFAGQNELDILGGFNLVYGYEKPYGNMLDEKDADDDKVANTVIGVYKEMDMGGFKVTPEFALSTGSGGGHYVAVNAEGALGIVDTNVKVENISKDFRGIAELLNQDPAENITFISFEGKIADENALDFVGFDVTADAAYRSFTTVDDATSAKFNLTAKNAYLDDKLSVTGKLEYQDTKAAFDKADEAQDIRDTGGTVIKGRDGKDLYEEADDKFDKSLDLGYAISDSLNAGALYKLNKDNDLSEHDYKLDYAQGIVTAGIKLDIETDVQGKETHIYAGLNANKEESYDVIGIEVTPYAQYRTWLEAEQTNIIAGVEASKGLGKYARLNAGYDYQDIENTGDSEINKIDKDEYDTGTLQTAFIGISYDITDDVTANAEYRKLKFDADNLENYEADLISAGVSIAF